MKQIVLYPGTFDPVTLAHLDVIKRASRLFDRLIVVVAQNCGKHTLFSSSERVEMIRDEMQAIPNVEAHICDGLLVNFAKQHRASFILRGFRHDSELQYELQMAEANRSLGLIETVFIPSRSGCVFLSSKLAKDIASHGGDVSTVVPPAVQIRLQQKIRVKCA